eukprot:scaffold2992_cov214-Amphora_coffeaeformis.AAC.14
MQLASLTKRFSTTRRLRRHASYATAKAVTTTFWCGKVVLEGKVMQGSIDVKQGVITGLYPGESYRDAKFRAGMDRLKDLGESYCLMPGLIDVHTHISALGRDWEGFTTATRAAAAGGITTLMGMPLNSLPPTVNVEALYLEQEAAKDSHFFVDVGLWGGILPESFDDLPRLLDSPYIFGVKAFLAPLPPSAGYAAVTPEQLKRIAEECGPRNLPILVHSELMTTAQQAEQTELAYANGPAESFQTHVDSRPVAWERDAATVVCDIVNDGVCNMHIVHLSDAGCLKIIKRTKESPTDKRLTVETCPHYLLFAMEELPDGKTTYKCFPPIRQAQNREELWRNGIKSGLIDMIASDHSPCEPHMRKGPLREVWGGLTGLQYQLPATWTAASERGYSIPDITRWWSQQPASLVPSLSSRKGAFKLGYQADLVWWDPDHIGAPAEYSQEHHRWKGDCVYADKSLRGRVLGTWLSGVHVYDGWDDAYFEAPGGLMRR